MSYSILDSLPEKDYDSLTTIAAEICNTPISLITLIDENRQWFKSHHGIELSETPIEYAFCTHTINDPGNIFIVKDSRKDERFFDNPVVVNAPHVIFYAGVPLKNNEGLPLGTLCVVDHKPGDLNERQIKSLQALSNQVMNLLELRKNKLELEKALKIVEENNVELERFAYIAAHDLKSPLNNISALTHLLKESLNEDASEETLQIINYIESSSEKLKKLIDALLDYSKTVQVVKENKTEINLSDLKNELNSLFKFKDNFKLTVKSNLTCIYANKTAVEQILINLVSNAIKYNDKPVVEVELEITEDDEAYRITIKDNGPGILKENQKKAFEIFETLNAPDKFGEEGTGIGLAIVKRTVEALGGIIYIDSQNSQGAKFVFTIEK
jgi:signal transduction histidine kinase